VEDLTPNPRKLLQIGTELRKLNKVIGDLTPVSELPLTARPRSRKEKNKLASRYTAPSARPPARPPATLTLSPSGPLA